MNSYKLNRKIVYLMEIALIAAAMLSCDEVNSPYRQQGSGGGDVLLNKRKIVLEEYTGFKCGNCPRASKLAHEIEAESDGQVFLMSVHAGSYADTDKEGLYQYDFKTAEGNALFKEFGISSNPVALISRARFSNSLIVFESSWAAKIDDLKKTEPKMLIRMFREYDAVKKEIYLDVEVTYLSAGDATHRLVLYILEDKIIKPQTDYSKNPVDIEEYEHSNVLRGSITGAWGEQLSKGTIPAGYVIRREYRYSIPDGKDWVPENLKILAMVQQADFTNKNYEVFQAEQIKVTQ